LRKTLILLGSIVLISFIGGFLVNALHSSKSDLSYYQKTLERYLNKADVQVFDLLSDTNLINNIYSGNHGQELKSLQKIKKNLSGEITLLFYHNKNLEVWTNTIAIPDYSILKNIAQQDTVIKLGNGFFKIRSYSLEPASKQRLAYSLVPIKFDFIQKNDFYRQFFPTGIDIPKEIHVTTFKTKYPVSNINSEPIAYLQSFNYKGKGRSALVFFLWLIGLLTFMIMGHLVATKLSDHYGVLKGVFIFLIVTILARYVADLLSITSYFADFVNSHNADQYVASPLLGETLLNVSFLLWLLLFTYKKLKVLNFDHIQIWGRFVLASVNYLAILLCALMIGGICKDLVLHSGIVFDFNNVFNIGRIGISALLGIIIFLIIFFIVSHRMSLVIRQMQLSLPIRIWAIATSFVAILPIYYNIDPGFALPTFYLVGVIYLVLFDLFVDTQKPSLSWMLIWLILFAGFSSILLFKYSKDVDIMERQIVAQKLLEANDQEVVTELLSILNRLKGDRLLEDVLESLDSQDEKALELNKHLKKRIKEGYYINHYYEIELTTESDFMDPEGQYSTYISQGFEWWQDSILIRTIPNQLHSYQIRFFTRLNINGSPVWHQLQLSRNLISSKKDFNTLLFDKKFKNIDELDKFSYAIYANDTLIESNQYLYERILPAAIHHSNINSYEWFVDDRTELVYKQGDFIVLVGRDLLGILKPMSLFSYIFILLLMVVTLLAFINNSFPILPDKFNFNLNFHLSLRNKIQLSVLILILVSFIAIGFITFIYFKNSTHHQEKQKLREKALSVQNDAEQKLQQLDLKNKNQLKQELLQLSNSHNTDLQLYSNQGRLLTATNITLFDNHLIAPFINPYVLAELKLTGKQLIINEDERIGKIIYKAAFVPLYKDSKSSVFAYISLPYSGEALLDPGNAKDFMGTLLNVYVFLLIIAGAIAILVANSITQPILVLGEKLKDFKLGTRNEPIPWDSNDELGALINEYNILIDKMEKSAVLLAQTEREVAWREMAKQVAHEIKNPLTPMKLSIQYLQHKISSLPKDEIEPLINRVATTLIEQIDNLNKIASEFSNFSKLPKPINEPLILNDLVSSVHDLFRKRDDIIFNLYVPIDEIFIVADRSHILRILNNLIKNAIQAIPGIRKGKIDIKLYTKNQHAIIQVSDNGTGITKDMQDKVFYPNFTTKSSGTGLGLAICKDMVVAYGGKIYFKTLENAGTDFYVELPLMPSEPS